MIIIKDLVNCDTIENILISEKINCDALIISNKTLQYSILYHSDSLKIFTDNLVYTLFQCISCQSLINSIPKIINQKQCPRINLKDLSISLSKINIAFTTCRILSYSLEYIDEVIKMKDLHKMNYLTFYSSKSDSIIMINQSILNKTFDDILQSKLDCTDLCGVYSNKDVSQSIILYYDPSLTQYKLKFNSE